MLLTHFPCPVLAVEAAARDICSSALNLIWNQTDDSNEEDGNTASTASTVWGPEALAQVFHALQQNDLVRLDGGEELEDSEVPASADHGDEDNAPASDLELGELRSEEWAFVLEHAGSGNE
eukprot:m.49018 g.49018  ORF g.49018 m.49018 type:complete len:121 (+) comp15001_c0_seq2:37-399(+)